MAVGSLLLGCAERDDFDCGSGGRKCDGDQVCVCGETPRCAEPVDDACESTGWRYKFGDRTCVTAAEVGHWRTDGTCPAAPSQPECGGETEDHKGKACDEGFCHCGLRRCVMAASRCTGRLAYSLDGGCVEEALTTLDTALLAQPDDAGICPEARGRPAPAECGVDGTTGCSNGDRCLCAVQRCIRDRETPQCPGGWVFASDGRCVAAADPDCPETGLSLAGVCLTGELEPALQAGLLPPSLTRCDDIPVTARPCGAGDPKGCNSGQQCLCSEAPVCVFEVEPEACASGLAETDTGRCVAADRATSARLATRRPQADGCFELDGTVPRCGHPDAVGKPLGCTSGACLCHEEMCVRKVTAQQCESTLGLADSGRCIEQPTGRCDSGYAWLSDPDECIFVPPGSTLAKVVGDSLLGGGRSYCAGKAPEAQTCGYAGAEACPTGSTCLCGTGNPRCARPSVACDSGLMYLQSEECVDDGPTRDELAYARPPGRGQICEDYGGVSAACGGADAGGGIQVCPAGRCLCHEHSCVVDVPIDACASGLALADGGRCIERPDDRCPSRFAWLNHPEECIEVPAGATLAGAVRQTLLAQGRDYCEGQAPPARPCGYPGAESCPSPATCLCDRQSPRCAQEEDRCASGLAFAPSGACVDDGRTRADAAYYRTRDGGMCEEFAPAAAECGVEGSGACSGGSVCLCGPNRCAMPVPAEVCRSGYALKDGSRCVERADAGCAESGHAWVGVAEGCIAISDGQTLSSAVAGAVLPAGQTNCAPPSAAAAGGAP